MKNKRNINFKDSLKSLKLSKGLWTVFFIITTFIFSINILNFSFIKEFSYKESSDTYATNSKQYYNILDNFVGQAEKDLFNREDNLEVMDILVTEYKNIPLTNYLQIYEQPLELYDTFFEDKFIDGYENNDYEHNKNIKISLEDGTEHSLFRCKCLWLDKTALDTFSVNILEGDIFSDIDYYRNDNREVAIIVGSNYGKHLRIGDKLIIEDFVGNTSAKVIGILNEGETISYNNNIFNLDNYIIHPMLEIGKNPKNQDDHFSQMVLSLFKTNGVFESKISANDLQKEVSNIFIENSINSSPYILQSSNDWAGTIFTKHYSLISSNIWQLITLVILPIAFTMLMIYLVNKRQNISIKKLYDEQTIQLTKQVLNYQFIFITCLSILVSILLCILLVTLYFNITINIVPTIIPIVVIILTGVIQNHFLSNKKLDEKQNEN